MRLPPPAPAAQASLTSLITSTAIATWRHDAASGLLVTDALGWSLLGLPPQPQGLPLADWAARLHPDDPPAVLAQLRQTAGPAAANGRPEDGQPEGGQPENRQPEPALDLGARCRHADGRWRYLLTRRVVQRNAQGDYSGHRGVVLDLSDTFAQQQHTLALAQRLELATAAAGVGIWSLSPDDPALLHWDEQMRALHRLAADQPTPQPADYLQRFVHPGDQATVAEGLATLMQRREGLLDLDLRIVAADGQVRRLASRTSIAQVEGRRQLHGVMLDVTERHLAEDRLRQAHERSALATRGAGIGTWESDADAAAGWWDEQMFKLRGLAQISGPVQTVTMMQWLHPDDRDSHARQLQVALQNDAPTNTEFRVVLPDGQQRWLASRSTPVRDEHGRTVRRIGINWDITDARNAAAAREERVLVQRESQAKSRFLARISHELRTPLNAVLGFSQLLLADGPDPTTWRQRVQHVQASGEHLLALIDDVLELSSLESGELPQSLQAVEITPLAQTSLPLVELLAREHQVTLRLGDIQGWALADPVRLRQVLLNLLSNGIKYNQPGGSVTVSAAPQDGWLLLRVQDTGRGLSEQQISHLFEPFNRLGLEREAIAGTGIGLAIVRAAVQQMGGQVRVHSQPGQGACFELQLQAATAPPERPALVDVPIGAAPPAARPAAGACVLYIEDNEVNLLIVAELLKSRPGLRFIAAADGLSGLALARSQQPTLILPDMQLPDIDGHAVLACLRADPATAGIRCIALSANAMPDDIARARAAGFDDYWTKPLDFAAFGRAMDGLLVG